MEADNTPRSQPAQVFPLGEYIAEELEARGWTAQDFAWAIENGRSREMDGQLVRDVQMRQVEIEFVIVCSEDKRCYSDENSLKAFACGLGVDWRFLDNLQRAYRES